MFPLRTNFELVKILKLYDGANDIEGRHKEYAILPVPIWLSQFNLHIAYYDSFTRIRM